MKESRFFKQAAAKHDKEHHKTGVHDQHSKDDHAHKSTPHEDKKGNRKEHNFPKERGEKKMKISTAPALSVAALAVLFAFNFVPDTKANGVKFDFGKAKDVIEKSAKKATFDFQPSTFTASKKEAVCFNASDSKIFDAKAFDPQTVEVDKNRFDDVTFKKFDTKDAEFKQFEAKDIDFQISEFKDNSFEKRDFEVTDSKKDRFEA
ncbi:MAG TPA: hypothetical protein VK363_05830 [Pyrinomonadaceae bacterium]|nr:hypothetical protein [Pyrinomonadaceae bacterium]